jgi:hypothetical protein
MNNLTQFWKDALVPLLIIAGYVAARLRPDGARRAGRAAFVLSAALLASIVICGIWRPSPGVVAYHRWAAHGLVILNWMVVFPAIGIAAYLGFKQRPWCTTGQIIGLVALLGFTLLSAITGYQGPTYQEFRAGNFVDDEMQNRFIVLHCVALPITVTLLSIGCFWSFRLAKPKAEG